MNRLLALGFGVWVLAGGANAQDPLCMWGPGDVLCQSSRMMGDFSDLQSADQIVGELAADFARGLREQSPYSHDYEPISDRCLIEPACNMAAKQTAHVNWLGARCGRGDRLACSKLRRGLSDITPEIPAGGPGIGVPYAPGTEPVPSVDPLANSRSGF